MGYFINLQGKNKANEILFFFRAFIAIVSVRLLPALFLWLYTW